MRALCNTFCIKVRILLQPLVLTLAVWFGLPIVPSGFRLIPARHLDVDPDVLRQLGCGNRAILHQAMQNWQASNERHQKQRFAIGDGFGTLADPHYWHQQVLPFLSIKTVRRMMADLTAAGMLVIDGTIAQAVGTICPAPVQMVLDGGTNCPPTIQADSKPPKANRRKTTPVRASAVAVFPRRDIGEGLETIPEQRESQPAANEGRDELADVPETILKSWTSTPQRLQYIIQLGGGIDRLLHEVKIGEALELKNPLGYAVRQISASPGKPTPLPPALSKREPTRNYSRYVAPDGTTFAMDGSDWTPPVDDEDATTPDFEMTPAADDVVEVVYG